LVRSVNEYPQPTSCGDPFPRNPAAASSPCPVRPAIWPSGASGSPSGRPGRPRQT
jgi:hypothetical protein